MEQSFLEVRRGQGTEVVGLLGERVTLGRLPTNTVSFPSDESVSRQHAVLELRPEGWCLRDLGSSNGTFLNGTRLVAEHTLQPGDEIAVGDSRMLFRRGDPPGDTGFAATPATVTPEEGPGYLDVGEEWGANTGRGGGTAVRPQPDAARASQPGPQPAPTPEPARAAQIERDKESHGGRRLLHGGSGHVRGVARGVQVRKSANDEDILAFRVDSYDASGNRRDPVAVELPGYKQGHLTDGEEVEVTGNWSHGTLRAKKILNLSTRAVVRGPSTGTKVFYVCLLVAIACFFAFIIYSIVTAPEVSNPFE